MSDARWSDLDVDERRQVREAVATIGPLLKELRPVVVTLVLAELLAERLVEWAKPGDPNNPANVSVNPEAMLLHHTQLVQRLTGDEPPPPPPLPMRH